MLISNNVLRQLLSKNLASLANGRDVIACTFGSTVQLGTVQRHVDRQYSGDVVAHNRNDTIEFTI